MNTGIQDAVVLAGRLADVVRGGAGDAHLYGYESARRPVARDAVVATDRLTRAVTARNPVARALRNAVMTTAGSLAPVRRVLAMNLSELSVDPERRPVTAAADQAVTHRR